MKPTNSVNLASSAFCWVIVVAYVLCLPYAIIVFDALIQFLSLEVARWVSWFAIISVALIYFGICLQRKHGFYFCKLVLPAILIVLSVVLFQTNPIKHIHLPEYALLAVLIHFAFGRLEVSLLIILFCTISFGISDELQQGINLDRYYGLKDMLVNAAGAMLGCLALNVFTQREFSFRFLQLRAFVSIFLLQMIVLLYSLYALLEVQALGTFAGVYHELLVLLNIFIALTALLVLRLSANGASLGWIVLNLVLAVNHGLIAAAALLELNFR